MGTKIGVNVVFPRFPDTVQWLQNYELHQTESTTLGLIRPNELGLTESAGENLVTGPARASHTQHPSAQLNILGTSI